MFDGAARGLPQSTYPGAEMTQPLRTFGIAASIAVLSTGTVSAQRGGGLPRIVTAPAAAPAAPAAAGGGRMGVPRYANPNAGPTGPHAAGLPRLTSYQAGGYRPGAGYAGGGGYPNGAAAGAPGQRFTTGASRPRQSGYTRM